jgi:CheY-like chemotaxis protein
LEHPTAEPLARYGPSQPGAGESAATGYYAADTEHAMSDIKSRAKVLCVDDDHGQRLLLSFLLERQGLEVRTANDGKEGVAIAQTWLPDLILMDLMMPGMDGFEATQILRADARTTHIPILALTAFGEEKMQSKARAVGMNGFVLKTILPADLQDVLAEHLPPSEP